MLALAAIAAGLPASALWLYSKQTQFYHPQAAQQTTTLRHTKTEPEPGLATWYGSWRITGHLTASGKRPPI
jgi:rare lipoprotein A (peptidoglycan hydrolase)